VTLRDTVLRGSAYLALRQIVSLGISLAGVVAVTRLIGPGEYGRYAGSLAIVTFLSIVGRFGVDTFIIRRRENPDERLYRTAFTVMAVNGVLLAMLGILLAPTVIGGLIGDEFVRPFQVLLLAVPGTVLLAPALASLERRLHYRPVAFLELGQNVLFYTAAVTLAVLQPDVWAPVAAYVGSQAAFLAGALLVARLPMRPALDRGYLRELGRYGVSYTSATFVFETRMLVNPLVVGGLLGPAAVGYVALAIRIADMLRFVVNATYRVSVSALAKIADDSERLRRSVSEGMLLQLLAAGPFLVGFAFVADPLVPAALGDEWEPTTEIFPFVAFGGIVFAVFSMQWALLFVLGRNVDVLRYNVTNVVLFVLAALVAVSMLDDPIGYGIAEAFSYLAVVWLHFSVGRPYHLDYRRLLPWLVAFLPPLASPFVPLPWRFLLLVPLAVVVALPQHRRELGGYLGHLRGAIRPGQAAA
jgi:O-antigen/teichoic acid export membrane protein